MFYFCFDIYHFVKGIFGIENLVVTIDHSRKIIMSWAAEGQQQGFYTIDNLNCFPNVHHYSILSKTQVRNGFEILKG